MSIPKCGLVSLPRLRGRVGVGVTVEKDLNAPLPTCPRSLREQGEGNSGIALECLSN